MAEKNTKSSDDDFFYEQTRKQIEHEDTLLNHRITWLLVIQGFLFSAYAYTFNGKAAVLKNSSQDNGFIDEIEKIQQLLSISGMVSSFFISLGIIASVMTIMKLTDSWDKKQLNSRYPKIIGHYRSLWMIAGFIPVLYLPLIFLIVWCLLEKNIWTFILIVFFYLCIFYFAKKNE